MSGHTSGPWVGFGDQGKPFAIFPAMRDGEICEFAKPPNEADFSLMVAAPDLLDALQDMTAICTRAAPDHDLALTRARAAIAKALATY